MVLTTTQTEMLVSYRDKAYITNILCDETMNFYNIIRNIVNIPLITSSAVMTILNSSEFSPEQMKYPNVIINGITTLILALINNFKLTEKINNFKTIGLKMIKLTHNIEDKLTNDLDNISIDNIRGFINEYDNLNESLEFSFPNFIKNRVKKRYINKKTLPNTLNCIGSFVENNSVVNV